MITVLKKYVRHVLSEEIGRDFKTIKFGDQVDILKDPRVSVEFSVIKKEDKAEHKVMVSVPDNEDLNVNSIPFSTNEEATHWAKNIVKNILVKLDQKNS